MTRQIASLALALALAVASPAAAQTPPPTPVIVTVGEGLVKSVPDRAWVVIAAESRAKTAPEAQRMNIDAINAVVARIKPLGIPADAIQTIGYNLQPDFAYENGRQVPKGFVARNSLQVRVDALAKTGDVIAAAVGVGSISVSNLRFDLKNRDAVEREALRLAVRDARSHAEAAANGAGVGIDRIVRIEEQRDFDMPRTALMPMASVAESVTVAGPAPVPIEAGEIEVRSRVTLTVAIK
jgi:uncharacterized protein YggE